MTYMRRAVPASLEGGMKEMPRRKYRGELDAEYRDPEFRRKFADLFALRMLLQGARLPTDYRTPEIVTSAISLTQEGREWADLLRPRLCITSVRHSPNE
jgi:hypothetical protein